mmetsp:Transcript_23506/g.65246  ORF Transcript_23506/g.65246 Transcript_23506/m.65246 type:complete len:138 (+) Transcript_23506:950-1363(+)
MWMRMLMRCCRSILGALPVGCRVPNLLPVQRHERWHNRKGSQAKRCLSLCIAQLLSFVFRGSLLNADRRMNECVGAGTIFVLSNLILNNPNNPNNLNNPNDLNDLNDLNNQQRKKNDDFDDAEERREEAGMNPFRQN